MSRVQSLRLALLLVAFPTYPQDFLQKQQRPVPPSARPDCAVTSLFPGTSCWTITPDGALWLGTPRGLWRHTASGWDYYASRRYLPSDQVIGLSPVPGNPRAVYIRTPKGDTTVDFTPLSLEGKAGLFENLIDARHTRHGFVAESALQRPGDTATSQTRSSDNDGLWTAMYGAAECFRYHVTGSPDALRRAERSVQALLYLHTITGISGYPARSYVKLDERRPADGVWYDNPNEKVRWKSDTSSDEIVGHFLLFSVAFDLLPNSPLRAEIASTTRRLMDHILSHGYYLIDRSGKPTTWGKWAPEYFASAKGRPDSPLNALELLSFLLTTRHITGDPKYAREYDKAARQMAYAPLTTRYQELAEEINYSDEELAMLSFYLLFRYENNPELLPTYRTALDGWWRNIERERNPLWNLIYLHSQFGVKDGDKRLAAARRTLEEIPLDQVNWTINNTGRRDLEWDGTHDRFNALQSKTWLSPAERPIMKWNGNPFAINGGDAGATEDDGTTYLLPYWLGRYWKSWGGGGK